MDKRRCDGRIHAAAHCPENASVSHLFANTCDGVFNNGRGSPVRLQAANINNKVLKQLFSIRCVMHFRMELHTEIFAFHVAYCCERAVTASGENAESLW